MGVLGKDLLDFHRPRTNTKVEYGVSGYWVESHPTMHPYGAVLTEILNLDAAPFQELLNPYRKAVAEKDAEQAARAFQAVTNGFASLPLYRLYNEAVQNYNQTVRKMPSALIAHDRPHHNRRQKRQEITSHTVLTAHPSHQEAGDPLQATHE